MHKTTMSNIVAKPPWGFSFLLFFTFFSFFSHLRRKGETPLLRVELQSIDSKKVPNEIVGNIVSSKKIKRRKKHNT